MSEGFEPIDHEEEVGFRYGEVGEQTGYEPSPIEAKAVLVNRRGCQRG